MANDIAPMKALASSSKSCTRDGNTHCSDLLALVVAKGEFCRSLVLTNDWLKFLWVVGGHWALPPNPCCGRRLLPPASLPFALIAMMLAALRALPISVPSTPIASFIASVISRLSDRCSIPINVRSSPRSMFHPDHCEPAENAYFHYQGTSPFWCVRWLLLGFLLFCVVVVLFGSVVFIGEVHC